MIGPSSLYSVGVLARDVPERIKPRTAKVGTFMVKGEGGRGMRKGKGGRRL